MSELRVRDHNKPCKHEEAVKSPLQKVWACNHRDEWFDFDCPGGREIVLKEVEPIGLGRNVYIPIRPGEEDYKFGLLGGVRVDE